MKLGYALTACAAAVLSVTTLASAGGGDLDPSFSGDGWLITRHFFGYEQHHRPEGVEDIALQADGKILVTGEHRRGNQDEMVFGAFRFTAGGDLDRSFGEGGWVVTKVGVAFDHPHAVEVQRDGKIVLAGQAICPRLRSCAALVRYLPDGSLDRGFGEGGIVRTDSRRRALSAKRLVIQPDGKLLVVTWNLLDKLVVARYLPDGRLDRTFSRDGFAIAGTRRELRAEDLALQRDGKIVVLGTSFVFQGSDFVVARFHRNGTLDRSFARGGFRTVDFRGRGDSPRAVAIQRDGRIMAVGGSTTSVKPGHLRIAMVRLNPNGAVDGTFGRRLTRPASGGSAHDVLVQPDGRIVVAGIAYRDPWHRQTTRWLVVRYLGNGRLDRTFGRGGFVIGDFGTGDDLASSLLMQPDGKLVVGGQIYVDHGIARYR